MKTLLLLLITLGFLSCNAKKQAEPYLIPDSQMIQNDSTLTLLVDAKYVISHGWGNVYQCTVKEVLEGKLDMDTISISVYAKPSYQGLLKELTTYPDLIIHFEKTDRSNGPPPGFRDKENVWWGIVRVEQKK